MNVNHGYRNTDFWSGNFWKQGRTPQLRLF
jgi:hypothetical protein